MHLFCAGFTGITGNACFWRKSPSWILRPENQSAAIIALSLLYLKPVTDNGVNRQSRSQISKVLV
jgi:hypothetical protein